MSNFILRTAVIVIALAVCPAALLRADVIYTDFGPGESFTPDSGDVLTFNGTTEPSVEFSPTISEELGEVDFVTSIDDSGDVNSVTVSVSADDGGQPGTALASQVFTDMGVLGVSSAILSWVPSTEVDLTTGSEYWITLAGASDITWNFNDQLKFGYSVLDGGTWTTTNNTLGALQIIGGSVAGTPEPGTALLLGLGLMAAIGLKALRAHSAQSAQPPRQ